MSASIPFLPSPGGRARRLATVALAAALGVVASSDAALADLSAPHKRPKPHPSAAAASDAGAPPSDAGDDAAAAASPMNPAEQQAQIEDIRAKATRIARAKGQRQVLRTQVEELLHGRGMDPGLKQELLLHARRVARLERARTVAAGKKDNDQTARAEVLLEQEMARHDGWMAAFVAKEPQR
ncbi:MAG: hypothetical protein WKG00_36170 [Polyangiaceae bacterium]